MPAAPQKPVEVLAFEEAVKELEESVGKLERGSRVLPVTRERELGVRYREVVLGFRAQEIAACVAFLVRDDASFITGSTISANGGQYMVG